MSSSQSLFLKQPRSCAPYELTLGLSEGALWLRGGHW